jgi:predicted thioesterase
MPAPAPGATAFAHLTVTDADTARAVGSGDVAVLATPRLLALCEEATVAALAPVLAPHETSVGARVVLDHLAPSPVGAHVSAEAVLTTVEGRRLTFRVVARQGERVIAQGSVLRVIAARTRFEGASD